MDNTERNRRTEALVEHYLHSAKRIAIESFGVDSAHGHAEVITRIAQMMASIEATDALIAATKDRKDD